MCPSRLFGWALNYSPVTARRQLRCDHILHPAVQQTAERDLPSRLYNEKVFSMTLAQRIEVDLARLRTWFDEKRAERNSAQNEANAAVPGPERPGLAALKWGGRCIGADRGGSCWSFSTGICCAARCPATHPAGCAGRCASRAICTFICGRGHRAWISVASILPTPNGPAAATWLMWAILLSP
jgi:hypothetical protein